MATPRPLLLLSTSLPITWHPIGSIGSDRRHILQQCLILVVGLLSNQVALVESSLVLRLVGSALELILLLLLV